MEEVSIFTQPVIDDRWDVATPSVSASAHDDTQSGRCRPSQVHDFAEARLEKQYIFLGLLAKRFKRDPSPKPDLSGVSVTVLDLDEGEEQALRLGGDSDPLKPLVYKPADGVPDDPTEETLRQIIDEFNQRLAGHLDVDPEVTLPWLNTLVDLVLRDETLRGQARDNDPDDFEDSLDLQRAIGEAVRGLGGDTVNLTEGFRDDEAVRQATIQAVSQMAHIFATHSGGKRSAENG